MNTGRPDEPRPADDAVDQAWRAASKEAPGAHIDAAILDAARAEMNRDQRRPVDAGRTAAPRQRIWWTAWQPLAAAATVAGLAFVLVQTMPRERDVAPPIAVEQALPEAEPSMVDETPAPAAPPPDAPEPPPQTADSTAAPREATVESTSAPPAAPTAKSRVEQPVRSRATTAAPAPAGVAAQSTRDLGEAQRVMESADFVLTPEAWAARVEELFAADDHAAAAAELRAFRAAHVDADQYLPEALRDWAGTVE